MERSDPRGTEPPERDRTSVTGLTTAAPAPKTLLPVTLPSGLTDLGAISLSGNQTHAVTAGTYQMSSISISGNGALIIDNSAGPVTFYVSGSISASGNGISNASGNPQKFTIFETGSADVSLSGNGVFFGLVYAPTSSISISGNSDLYGAFAGASISINGNGAIHYDQLSRTIPGPPGAVKLMAQWTLPS